MSKQKYLIWFSFCLFCFELCNTEPLCFCNECKIKTVFGLNIPNKDKRFIMSYLLKLRNRVKEGMTTLETIHQFHFENLTWSDDLAYSAEGTASSCGTKLYAHPTIKQLKINIKVEEMNSKSKPNWKRTIGGWYNDHIHTSCFAAREEAQLYYNIAWPSLKYVGCGLQIDISLAHKMSYAYVYVCYFGPEIMSKYLTLCPLPNPKGEEKLKEELGFIQEHNFARYVNFNHLI